MSQNPVQKAMRRYVRDLFICMGLYVILLLISSFLLREDVTDSALRYVLAFIPVLPLLAALWVFIRMIREVDEFQRKIQFEAISFSVGATMIMTLTLGFIERAGFPQISMIWVAPMMVAFWGIGLAIANRKYR